MDNIIHGIPDSSLKGELREHATSLPSNPYHCFAFPWVHPSVSVALAVVSVPLTTLSLVVINVLGAVFFILVVISGGPYRYVLTRTWDYLVDTWTGCYRKVIIAVQYCLSPIWTNCYRKVIIPVRDRLTRIAERRARERAPQARDVTTELSTAPGEFYP